MIRRTTTDPLAVPDSLDTGAERRLDSLAPVSTHAAPLIATALTGAALGSGAPGGGRFNATPINSRGETARTAPTVQPAAHGRRLR
jgi:hypothetical protein